MITEKTKESVSEARGGRLGALGLVHFLPREQKMAIVKAHCKAKTGNGKEPLQGANFAMVSRSFFAAEERERGIYRRRRSIQKVHVEAKFLRPFFSTTWSQRARVCPL